LHYAALYGHDDTVKRLLAAGADTKLRNAEGKTAAEIATGRTTALFH
jgi:ankyrin repeat protein